MSQSSRPSTFSTIDDEQQIEENQNDIQHFIGNIRQDIGNLIDQDRRVRNQNQQFGSLANKKSPHRSKRLCSCNFVHYSLRQLMREAEQIKQVDELKFALNTSLIGLDPSKLEESNPGICIPMYESDHIGDLRFPDGFSFGKSNDIEIEANQRMKSMIIQTVPTSRGDIQIQLDPQSFGLAPFFDQQYEHFIKSLKTSIFVEKFRTFRTFC